MAASTGGEPLKFNSFPFQKSIDEADAITSDLLLHRAANWGDILSAAPRTLCSMGICFVIAWSEQADKLQTGDKETQHNLRSNLIDCSNRGRDAFRAAQDNVFKASIKITNITETGGSIEGIQDILNESNITAADIYQDLCELQKHSQQCVDSIGGVIQSFQRWKDLVETTCKPYSTPNDGDTVKPAKTSAGFPRIVWNRVVPFLRWFGVRVNIFCCKRIPLIRKKKVKSDELKSGVEHAKQLEAKHEYAKKQFQHVVRNLGTIDLSSKDSIQIYAALRDCRNNQAELLDDMKQLHSFMSVLNKVVQRIAETLEPMGDESLSDTQISELRNDFAKLHTHYAIAGDICSTYVEVSQKYFMPGISKVDSLSLRPVTPAEIPAMRESIANFAQQAQNEIDKLANKRRETLRSHYHDLNADIEELN